MSETRERDFFASFKQVYPPARKLEIGSRVHIVGDHPHAGRTGTAEAVESTLAGVGLLVRFDDGDGCFVFDRAHLRLSP